MSWDFRAPGAPHHSYSDPKLFSIRISHGGQISGNCYASGNVAWFDYCDKDRMSMTEIDNMVRELGYDGVITVVESECKDSWVWFLELLVKDVEIVNQFGYTFISDNQKGLLPAFEQVVPNNEHRFCASHLFPNFILQFKGKSLSDKFWGAAKATTIPQFARQMEELKNLDKDAYDSLIELEKPLKHWSRSHFNTM
ncbi:hypothetical protein L3X38_025260 [Prunus dulcis]|uniref:MULE transposase domain-containing protein n=1 Tax=Prunus dulcis TaxID=3755 RepID=A0AAD4W390_PRUDU|nr:hypothetical protein L3X38_025260 [Prunus dulcis]